MQRLVIFSLLAVGLLGPAVAEAQVPAGDGPAPFRFELEQADRSHRGPGVEGYVYNDLPWRITNVRLRVESVDSTGKVTGEALGWVLGDVKPGGRAYFFVPVSSPAGSYRATVQSFDKVSIEPPRSEAP